MVRGATPAARSSTRRNGRQQLSTTRDRRILRLILYLSHSYMHGYLELKRKYLIFDRSCRNSTLGYCSTSSVPSSVEWSARQRSASTSLALLAMWAKTGVTEAEGFWAAKWGILALSLTMLALSLSTCTSLWSNVMIKCTKDVRACTCVKWIDSEWVCTWYSSLNYFLCCSSFCTLL